MSGSSQPRIMKYCTQQLLMNSPRCSRDPSSVGMVPLILVFGIRKTSKLFIIPTLVGMVPCKKRDSRKANTRLHFRRDRITTWCEFFVRDSKARCIQVRPGRLLTTSTVGGKNRRNLRIGPQPYFTGNGSRKICVLYSKVLQIGHPAYLCWQSAHHIAKSQLEVFCTKRGIAKKDSQLRTHLSNDSHIPTKASHLTEKSPSIMVHVPIAFQAPISVGIVPVSLTFQSPSLVNLVNPSNSVGIVPDTAVCEISKSLIMPPPAGVMLLLEKYERTGPPNSGLIPMFNCSNRESSVIDEGRIPVKAFVLIIKCFSF